MNSPKINTPGIDSEEEIPKIIESKFNEEQKTNKNLIDNLNENKEEEIPEIIESK